MRVSESLGTLLLYSLQSCRQISRKNFYTAASSRELHARELTVNTAKISLLDRIGTRSRVTPPPPRWARVTVHYSWTPMPSGHRCPAEQTPTSAATTEPTIGKDCSAPEFSRNLAAPTSPEAPPRSADVIALVPPPNTFGPALPSPLLPSHHVSSHGREGPRWGGWSGRAGGALNAGPQPLSPSAATPPARPG